MVRLKVAMRLRASQIGPIWLALAIMAWVCPSARAVEHVTLKNGFELDCVRSETVGDKVRLYLAGSGASSADDSNYLEVAADAIVRVDAVAEVPLPATVKTPLTPTSAASVAPTKEEMHQMLAHAGAAHNIDEDLLASVVRAESGGQVRAVSRTGARGLMQLMPGTASAMGVDDAFQPEQNIAGGSAYLDALLTRYHDNVALALAAYNAGPGAVDKYHGVPPYRETREYVARVIREFNRRKQAALIAQTK
jgi:soluble lytic murein transglycosylase-like protein